MVHTAVKFWPAFHMSQSDDLKSAAPIGASQLDQLTLFEQQIWLLAILSFFLHFSCPIIMMQVQRVGERMHSTIHLTMVPPEMNVVSYHLQITAVKNSTWTIVQDYTKKSWRGIKESMENMARSSRIAVTFTYIEKVIISPQTNKSS